jgi:hypothetical protein
LAFLGLTGNFEPCVTLGRFDKRPRDAWPLPNFDIDSGVRDAWLSIWMKYYSICNPGRGCMLIGTGWLQADHHSLWYGPGILLHFADCLMVTWTIILWTPRQTSTN